MEENTALGLNSVILPGVTIGKNSWVGVSSYVTSDIPPNSIASGCPAKVVKERQLRE
jgi:acetyltransferase-like isoleucine patch superfamily enzyme